MFGSGALTYRAMDSIASRVMTIAKTASLNASNARAFGKAKFPALRVVLRQARSFGPVGEEDIGYRPTCVF
jgi:hypothetical protein